jgi:hypothetical protein
MRAVYYRCRGSEPVDAFIEALRDLDKQATLDNQIERLNMLRPNDRPLPFPCTPARGARGGRAPDSSCAALAESAGEALKRPGGRAGSGASNYCQTAESRHKAAGRSAAVSLGTNGGSQLKWLEFSALSNSFETCGSWSSRKVP